LQKFACIIGLALIASVAADVSHLFDGRDGYEYEKPAGQGYEYPPPDIPFELPTETTTKPPNIYIPPETTTRPPPPPPVSSSKLNC